MAVNAEPGSKTDRLTTQERILRASRKLFNEKGYAATTLAEISKETGIAQGNLTYHFPTKKDLVNRLDGEARGRVHARRHQLTPGAIADDYVEHLLFAMNLTWEYRFLQRDRAQYTDEKNHKEIDPDMVADFDELFTLLERIDQEGLFRNDLDVDLKVLTRALWVISRYWMDHLRELEGVSEVRWQDQERGIEHHFAVLLPCLSVPARRMFNTALKRLSNSHRKHWINP